MSQSIIIVVLNLIIYDLTSCEIPIDCNRENVFRCWAYIRDSSALQSVIPSLEGSELNDFCRKFDYFNNCFTPIREKCINYVLFSTLVVYEGYRNAFSYLCKESTGEYLKYQPCFNGQNLQLNTIKCNESLSEQLGRIHNSSDAITVTDKMCQAGDLFLGCVDNNVRVLCKEAAASWMMTYNRKIFSPLLSTLPCDGWTMDVPGPQNNNATTIVLAVCLSLICIIIAVLALVLICHLKPQLFESLPIMKRINASKIQKESSSRPPPYATDPPTQTPRHDGELQTSDEGSHSSGYFSTFEKADDGNHYFGDSGASCTSEIDRRVSSVEAISFSTSGKKEGLCRTSRSRSAECTPELPRFLQQNVSPGTVPLSSTITPPHFEPPVANPFTSPALKVQKDDPIITDYYC